MTERFLTEERPLDTNVTTATLAGVDQRSRIQNDTRRNADELNVADRTQINQPDPINVAQRNSADESAPLFPAGEAAELHSRWDAIQVAFVDEPRRAVEQADALVAAAMKRLAEIFADERSRLEGQWDRGDSISTEDLRLALRRYRSFFGRMLSV